MSGKIVLKIVSALVLIAAIGGIAFLAFNAGLAQGVATKLPVLFGASVPAQYPYEGVPLFWHPYPYLGFGFGCFAPLIALFLIFFALRALGFLFWGHHWGHNHAGHWGGRWGYGRGPGEKDVPPMFSEWHRRAHGDPETEKKE